MVGKAIVSKSNIYIPNDCNSASCSIVAFALRRL